MPEKVAVTRAKHGDALAEKLARIGVSRDADLVLHLPLRYEDHTQVRPLADVRSGETVQTEGVIINADIQYRPRRQLVCLLRDPERSDASLVLRFPFYPSHQKALTAARACACSATYATAISARRSCIRS